MALRKELIFGMVVDSRHRYRRTFEAVLCGLLDAYNITALGF